MGQHVTLNDNLISMYTSLGEKSDATKYISAGDLKPKELMAMYKSSWAAKKFIDKTAEDIVKMPRNITGGVSDDGINLLNKIENQLNIDDVRKDAIAWASLMGDVIVVALTDCDDSEIASPVNFATEEIRRFLVVDRESFSISKDVCIDISSLDFSKPMFYSITAGGGEIKFHHSRCHRIKLGRHSFKKSASYGTSDLQAPYNIIKMFDKIMLSISDSVEEANVDVLKAKDLNTQISAGQENKIIQYAQLMKQVKSSMGLILIDSDDDYLQKSINFGGLSDIARMCINVLAGALDRPVTIVFGLSSSGFSSGKEDNKIYHGTINSLQESRLRPLQDFIDKFTLDKAFSDSEKMKLEYDYPSIAANDEMDDASIFTSYSTGIKSLLESGVIDEEVALRELVSRNILKTVNDDDIEKIVSLLSSGGWNEDTRGDGGESEGEKEYP